MERTLLIKEQRALTFLAFCVAVVIARSNVFYAEATRGLGPRVVINGIHIHHFVMGIALLLAAVFVYRKSQGERRCLRAILVGVGLGLVLDETSLWFPLGPDGYWAAQNFFVPLVACFFLALQAFPLAITPGRRAARAIEKPITPRLHRNPAKPFVTIVIPAFNEGRLLAKTLDSMLDQSYKDFELIVVDNNSTDDTAEVARSFGAIVITETRQGVSHARQRGFTEAKGTVIATTDADTIVPPGWLARIAHEFKKDDGLVAFGGLFTLYSGPMTARLAIAYLSLPAWKVERFFYHGWSIPGANLAVRSSSFHKIGGFNTSLKLCEDVDLCHRIKKLGRVGLDPKFLVSTSGRRFKNGLVRGLLTYGPNHLARLLLKKHTFDRLPVIRAEFAKARRLSFVPPTAAIVLVFSMFYFSNPSISGSQPVIRLVGDREEVTQRLQAVGHFFYSHVLHLDGGEIQASPSDGKQTN
ncbi:MAG: glycosyltransferase family 2 protein [Dehalococcoidia bacterium]|nr:glycosyltransferase family 2 protein [Dehalococcoidia bacterium]